MYAFSSTETIMYPFSYFKSPFRLPKYENGYDDFFKDIQHPSIKKQQVVVFPKEMHFGYVESVKTLSFKVCNYSNKQLYINWIQGEHRKIK